MPVLALLGLLLSGSAQAAAVSGRVTDQATGRPVPRMVVTAIASDVKTAGETMTDEEGRYEIAGLQPGAYAIGVWHDEHRSTYLPQWVGERGPSTTYSTPSRFAVELKPGERRRDLDVALTRALAIEGVVSDPWGDPLPQVQVSVVSAARSMPSGESYANDLGMYRVFGLAPGRYRVCVTPRGGATMADVASLGPTCYPAAASAGEASDVTLTSQDATGIDIRVQRTGTRTIAGSVVDAAGMPADGAMVTAQAFDEPGSSAHARTANGTFTLKGLAPGRYAVTAAIGGAGPGDPNPPKREREMGSATVDLTATDGATLTIPLSKGVTVTGTVTFEGRMTPAQLRNLRVEPRQSGEQRPWMMDFPRVAAVKEDATFALDGLYRTPAYIVVRGLPDGWALKTVRYGDRDITDVPTDFASSPPAHLELVVTSRVASLTAKAVDDRGEQILASIVAVPANPRRWAFPFIVGQGDARAGAVKLGPMVPGDYFVAALPLEDMVVIARDPSRLAALATVGTKVTLEAGDTRLLTLRVTPLPDR